MSGKILRSDALDNSHAAFPAVEIEPVQAGIVTQE